MARKLRKGQGYAEFRELGLVHPTLHGKVEAYGDKRLERAISSALSKHPNLRNSGGLNMGNAAEFLGRHHMDILHHRPRSMIPEKLTARTLPKSWKKISHPKFATAFSLETGITFENHKIYCIMPAGFHEKPENRSYWEIDSSQIQIGYYFPPDLFINYKRPEKLLKLKLMVMDRLKRQLRNVKRRAQVKA